MSLEMLAKRVAIVVLAMMCACARSDRERPAYEVASEPWTRAQWLDAAEQLVARPITAQDMREGAARQLFHRLLRSEAWREVDFSRDGEDALRYYPVVKKLTIALFMIDAKDELVTLGLFGLEVQDELARSARAFLIAMPESDPTRANRVSGFSKMLVGVAMSVCELLYFARDASEERRDAVFDRLSQAAAYAQHSSVTLQLILATLDEYLLAPADARFRSRYQTIREVVAKVHAELPAPASDVRVTYQGMPPSPMMPIGTVRISRTGGFAVTLPAVALAKRVEVRGEDGTWVAQHVIEAQLGNLTLEASCIEGASEGASEEQFVAAITSEAGVSEISGKEPGRWFDLQTPTRRGRIRVTTLHGRLCVAAIEGPSAEVPAALLDSFPGSLRLAPTGG